jgi:teichoic acid transport system permease protein
MQNSHTDRLAAGGAEALAQEYGLKRIGARPMFGQYVRSLWARRQFLWTLSAAKAYAQNRDNYLGQLWNILNPLLWSAVYGLVFGVLLDGRQGMTAAQYIPFLVVGVTMFRYMATGMTAGSKAIQGNISLVRSLHFPRCIMPISVALSEFILMLPGLVVIGVIVIASGQGPSWTWLAFPAVVTLILAFTIGLSFITARLVVEARDVANLLPFIVRLLLYTSGVFYAIDRFEEKFVELGVPWLATVASHQPFALYLDLSRASLTEFREFNPLMWLLGVGYAILFLVGGFIYFWRAEERYGRD